MKYTENQVLDILKLVTNQPKEILNKWLNKKDNEYLNLTKYSYPLFLYSFPIIVNNEKVATMTLSQLRNTGVDGHEDMLMSKYLTTNIYNSSWDAFSHKSYLMAYLTIHKDFKLPSHPKDNEFYVFESTFLDSDDKEIKYRMSYGDSEITGLYHSYVTEDGEWRCYRFDNGVSIQIEDTNISGWEMGKKINEVIKERIRDQKIDIIIDKIKTNE